MTKSKKPPPKSAIVTKLLGREKGVSIAEMAKSTGWKNHSVRAFLTGLRKKHRLSKEERSDGVTAYRLTAAETPEPALAQVTGSREAEAAR